MDSQIDNSQDEAPMVSKPQTGSTTPKPIIYILPGKLSQTEREELKSKVEKLGGSLLSQLSTLTSLHKTNQISRVELIFLANSKAPKMVTAWIKKAFKDQGVMINEDELNNLNIVSIDWLNESSMCSRFTDFHPFKIALSSSKPKPNLNSTLNQISKPSSQSSDLLNAFQRPVSKRKGSPSRSEPSSEDEDGTKENEKLETSSDRKGKGKERERSPSSPSKRIKTSSDADGSKSSSRMTVEAENDESEQEESDLELDSDLPPELDQVTILEPSEPIPDHTSTMEYACQRATPYKCINQPLIDELNLIKDKRALYQTSAIGSISGNSGFVRAIAALKSFKYDLKDLPNPSNAAKMHIKNVGTGTEEMLKEYYSKRNVGNGNSLETCTLNESEKIKSNGNQLKMIKLSKLKGLDPQKVRKIAKEENLKSLKALVRNRKTRLGTGLDSAKVLEIRKDVIRKISRKEVELIRDEIVKEMTSLVPDLKHYLVGSYRRGHPISDSVELVFTSPKLGDAKSVDSLKEVHKTTSLLDDLMDRLIGDGRTFRRVSIFSPKTYEDSQPLSPLSILSFAYLPSKSYNPTTNESMKPIYRIVEINFCRPDVLGCQLLGRTGSKLFVTDFQRWCVEKGFKFHATGISSQDSPDDIIPTPTEKDVFELVKLPYMPPHVRNCDP